MGKYPEKRAYLELNNEIMKFTFPVPGAIEGAESRKIDMAALEPSAASSSAPQRQALAPVLVSFAALVLCFIFPHAYTAFRSVLFSNLFLYPFVTSYSGGWKTKMQLCVALLMNIICTSHFMPFLEKMCTRIIDFKGHKLKTFKGTKDQPLTQFVEKYPEKKAYFGLSPDIMKFTHAAPALCFLPYSPHSDYDKM